MKRARLSKPTAAEAATSDHNATTETKSLEEAQSKDVDKKMEVKEYPTMRPVPADELECDSTPALKRIDFESDEDDSSPIRSLSKMYVGLQSGYDVSRQEIAKAKKAGKYEEVAGLGYGEVDVEAFAQFVKALPSTHSSGIFLDLGSGSGKAVLSAAFAGNFSKCIGIEIVKPLHELAQRAQGDARAIDGEAASKAEFQHGDIFRLRDNWSLADVILVTCTLFTDEMMLQLDEAVEELVKPGALVITTTRRLSCPRARYVSEGRVKYAKGSLLFIVYTMQ